MSTTPKTAVGEQHHVPVSDGNGSPLPASLSEIQRVAEQIVERFRPQRIVLFGSYAYGKPTADSDVDLLVLMEPDGSALQMAARIGAEIDHPFPIDILVWDPQKWSDSVGRGGVFATEVETKGIQLYEAGD